MTTWTQDYHPTGGLIGSTLLAAVPVVVLLALLGLFHVRAHWAALIGLASAVAIMDSPQKLVGVVIFFAVYFQIESVFLSPRIMRAARSSMTQATANGSTRSTARGSSAIC